VVSVRSKWNKVCSAYSIDSDTARTFLISFCGLIYDDLLKQCQIVIRPSPTSATPMPTEDTDDVYYRFGGAAIAAMFKVRIRNFNCADKDQVSMEISILQKLSMHLEEDKTHIPAYLKYRDKGFMYFPTPEMLPLLKAVDVKTIELANNGSFTELGSDMIKKVVDYLDNNADFLTMFSGILIVKVPEIITLPFAKLNGLFTELVRKHTRIQEFLDAYKQSAVSKQGAATLKEVNLRDTLLGHHVNLKNQH